MNGMREPFASSRMLFVVGWGLFAAVYFPVLIWAAGRKLFWYDELFTFYVSSQSSVGVIWRCLLGGMDNHPPLDYLIRHVSLMLPVSAEVALRLPSIVAGFGTVVFAFLYAREAHSVVAGFCASALVCSSPMFLNVLEGRGYALSMFCGVLFLWFWSRARRSAWRSVWDIAGVGVSVAIPASIHYYGAFLLWPLGLGILAVWWARCSNRPLLLLFPAALGAVAVVGVLPFAYRASTYSAHFWASPPSFSQILVNNTSLALIGSMALLAWLARGKKPVRLCLTRQEFLVLYATATLPLVQWTAARLVTHAYLPRYTIFGFAAVYIVIALALGVVLQRLQIPVWLVGVVCWIAATAAISRLAYISATDVGVSREMAMLAKGIPNAKWPVVAADPMRYIVQYHYGSPVVKRGLVLLTDRAAAVRYSGTDTNDIGLTNLGRFVPLRIERYEAFTRDHAGLMLTNGVDKPLTWLAQQLRADGYTLRRSGQEIIAWECVRTGGPNTRTTERLATAP